jgi:hypothetical protein
MSSILPKSLTVNGLAFFGMMARDVLDSWGSIHLPTHAGAAGATEEPHAAD